MGPSGSTVTGPPGAGPAGLSESTARRPPDELAALLVPLVARAARTERGPRALVRWLRQCQAPPTEQTAPAVAETLARLLFTAHTPQDDTLDDA